MTGILSTKFATVGYVDGRSDSILALLDSGDHPYGQPAYFLTEEGPESTNLQPGPSPYNGAVVYAVGPSVIIPAGRFLSISRATVSSPTANTDFWWDIRLGGAPSPAGPSSFTIGVANGVDSRQVAVYVELPVPTPIQIDVIFARAGTTGTVTMRRANVEVYRIGDYP